MRAGMPRMDRDITLQRCAPIGAPYGVDVSIHANGSLGYEPSKHHHHHHRSLHDRQEQHAKLQRLLKGAESKSPWLSVFTCVTVVVNNQVGAAGQALAPAERCHVQCIRVVGRLQVDVDQESGAKCQASAC